MDSHEIKILTDRLIPVPKEIKFRDGREYPIAGKCKVAIHAAETGGISEKAEKLFKDYWNAEAEITLKHPQRNSERTPTKSRLRKNSFPSP